MNMAEMHHDERGYTVTLTDREYDALKTKALERDALAAELAQQKEWHANWLKVEPQYIARIRELEAALRDCVDADSEPYGGSVRAEAIYRARQLLTAPETKGEQG